MVRKVSVCQIYKARAGGTKVVIVFFTLTNRALHPVIYVVANPVHTWSSTGLDKTRSEDHLQSYDEESMETKTKQKHTCQKTLEEEGHCKEVQRSTCHIMVTAPYSKLFSS